MTNHHQCSHWWPLGKHLARPFHEGAEPAVFDGAEMHPPTCAHHSTLIDKKAVTVPSSLVDIFGEEKKVTRIRRVRFEDGIPISYGINHIPHNLTKGISAKDLRAGTDVTELLKKKSKVKYGRIVDSFEAKPASPMVAQYLDVQILTPVILFTTVHRDTDDRVVNVAWTYIRADKYMFSFSRDAESS